MNEQIKKYILHGNFKEAYYCLGSHTIEDLQKLLLLGAFDVESITFYGFINYLISVKESSSLHDLAADILAYPLSYIEGAYQTALYHSRKALELDPNNLEYLQFLLFYHDLPDKLINKEEAIEIARTILRKKPENSQAKEILEKYNA